MTLKTQKPTTFSTWFDIVNIAQVIKTEGADLSDGPTILRDVVRYKAQLEEAIVQVDAVIWAKLRPFYAFAILTGTDAQARVTVPVPDPRNTGDTELISVLLNTSVVGISTAAWNLLFTDFETYNIYSSLEALQGASWKLDDETKTSTNGEITIEDGFWVENWAAFDKGDRFYFSVVKAHTLVHFVSNLLATGHALTSIFTSNSPNESSFGEKLWERGMKLLDQLCDEAGTMYLDGSAGGFNKTSISIDYEINELGFDVSPYLLDQYGLTRFPTAESDPDVG